MKKQLSQKLTKQQFRLYSDSNASLRSHQRYQKHRPTPDSDREGLDSLDLDSMSSESNSSDDELVQAYDGRTSIITHVLPLPTHSRSNLSPDPGKTYIDTLGNGCFFYINASESSSPWRMTQEDFRLPRFTDTNPLYSNKERFYHKGFRYSVVTPIT